MQQANEGSPVGLDVGTSRIVTAHRVDAEYRFQTQLNAFVDLPYSKITESTLKKEKVLHSVEGQQIVIHRGREPQQERSRESLRRLIKATTEVLGQHGLQGTSIPRIARRAGLTPGAVYRRFHDKEALLETAILGILERQDERVRTGMSETAAARIPLDVLAEQLIGSTVASYRVNAPLLSALRQFVRLECRQRIFNALIAVY